MDRTRAADRYGANRRFQRRIVFISGDNTRTVTVGPVMAGLVATTGALLAVGLLGATSYLLFRDDLISAAYSRNAAMQQAYEDRIASLRAEIDKIASRQILDQVAFDEKVDRLLTAQRSLGDRQKVVSELIERAKASGLLADGGPVAPDEHAAVADPVETGTTAYAGESRAAEIEQRFAALTESAVPPVPSPAPSPVPATVADTAPPVPLDADGKPDLRQMALQLALMEQQQAATVRSIAEAADQRADKVASVIGRLGVTLRPSSDGKADRTEGDAALGGPYLPLNSAEALNAALYEAEDAFGRLGEIRKVVARLPIAEPIEGAQRTSNFGSRSDPFLGSAAFHAGVDFRSPTGTRVGATAPGTVIAAGRNGGYGLMVEVDHGKGLTTRYAHLSAIKVKVGEKVQRGTTVGLVGSTGRSTGPHLHYETRVAGTAVNPGTYLRAGDEIERILD